MADVPIRPAATILLIRDGRQGLEVFMVERHHRIDFASSALVFPGGRVETDDDADDLRALSLYEEGLPSFRFCAAAIREAFEETGLLLAKRSGSDAFISGEEAFALWDYREKIERGDVRFADFLKQHDLVIDCASLVFYAHWITPDIMPKRFDTYFFIAAAPEGQAGLHDGREMVDSVWITPKTAIADGEIGRRQVIFPTRMNLSLIAECESTAQAMAEAGQRQIVTVLPKLDKHEGQPILRLPKHSGYPVDFQLLTRPA